MRELGWITAELSLRSSSSSFLRRNGKKISLYQACWLRGQRFMPLQYILGSQPFGPLDIKCAKRVLIPRWETEEWAFKLARLVQGHRDELRASNLVTAASSSSIGKPPPVTVTDLCTGTGCILLLLSCYLGELMRGYAVDIEPRALQLVYENIHRNRKVLTRSRFGPFPLPQIEALWDDILNPTSVPAADLITANPPYISRRGFKTQTERSVKRHEPHKALLGGQEFYRAILDYADAAEAKAVVCEVGDQSQIDFCQTLSSERGWSSTGFNDSADNPRGVAMWRDPNWSFLTLMSD